MSLSCEYSAWRLARSGSTLAALISCVYWSFLKQAGVRQRIEILAARESRGRLERALKASQFDDSVVVELIHAVEEGGVIDLRQVDGDPDTAEVRLVDLCEAARLVMLPLYTKSSVTSDKPRLGKQGLCLVEVEIVEVLLAGLIGWRDRSPG